MPKTPTTERETATFRLPAALLERSRKDGAERGLAYVRSVEEALEVYFFARLPPPMAEALEQDIKGLKVSRENYFYSLLDPPPTPLDQQRSTHDQSEFHCSPGASPRATRLPRDLRRPGAVPAGARGLSRQTRH